MCADAGRRLRSQVWAYLIFLILTVVTSDFFYVLIFRAGGVWILIEVVIGFFVARSVLENYVGKVLIFRKTGDMTHPVFWTWYSTYLLLVNIIKGLLAGIIRMVTMIVLLILQIGVMDRSNFPEGLESKDPAFVAFLSTLLFHHRFLPLRGPALQPPPCPPPACLYGATPVDQSARSSAPMLMLRS